MADNVVRAATAGGATIRTLDRSGVETQIEGLDIAQSGGAELLGLGFPTSVSVASGGLTTASTAYIAGDVLGTEFTFTLARASGRGAVITSARLIDKAKVTGPVDLFLFDRASTPAADNAANSWADSDMANLLGVISLETPIASALNSVARGVAGLPLVILGNASTDIKGVLVTRTGHTFFGATTDLVVQLGVEQF